MKRDVQGRIRKRIRDRLDELRMTGRELAKACGHSDAWISGILNGRDGLRWTDLDQVALKLKLSPSELVRWDDDELRELTPTEMRLLRHYRSWPDAIKDHWLEVLDFFAPTAADPGAAILLTHLRRTPHSLRGPVIRWLEGLLREGIPPAYIVGAGGFETGEATGGKKTTRPARPPGRLRGTHDDGGGLRSHRKN